MKKILLAWTSQMFLVILGTLLLALIALILYFLGNPNLAWLVSNFGVALWLCAWLVAIIFWEKGARRLASNDWLVNRIVR